MTAMKDAPLADLERRLAAGDSHAAGVRDMFDRIAPTYDTLNHLLSAGIDVRWRKLAIETLAKRPAGPILDSCAGTMDLTAMIAKRWPHERVIAADFAAQMLDAGKQKAPGAERVVADAMAMPFDDASFAAMICGFGMRNLADTRRGVREARRVLKKGGVFTTLEFFRPTSVATKLFHGVYGNVVLPTVGGLISGDRSAYAYLNQSMKHFVSREGYEALCNEEGFRVVRAEDLTLGVASLVVAEAV
jgi:ubiquinone/menaquinone biosynthesis methyltransferase